VVIGGFEVANIPERKFGLLASSLTAWIPKLVLRYADKILVVDASLKRDAIRYTGINRQDILVVPTGYDFQKFSSAGIKRDIVLTVGGVSYENLWRKGFETFVRAAQYLPDLKFIVIGKFQDESINYLKSIAPPNVEFVGYKPEAELIKYYQRAKVYCQLSRHEGLPNALCEAMLCECVPVGARYYGIPTAIGDAGFYVPYGDVKATAEAIKNALRSNKGRAARARIKRLFSMGRRERKLLEVFREVVTT
jgi:glycosyltransferase involved in cell wall biosynthesis